MMPFREMPLAVRRRAWIAVAILLVAGGVGLAAWPSSTEAGIERFGVDADKNGVPDRLDAFVDQLDAPSETREAARGYYRLISRLADDALNGLELSEIDKQRVFAALGCYANTATADGVAPINLGDPFRRTREGFRGHAALNVALNGTLAKVTLDREKSCLAAM